MEKEIGECDTYSPFCFQCVMWHSLSVLEDGLCVAILKSGTPKEKPKKQSVGYKKQGRKR